MGAAHIALAQRMIRVDITGKSYGNTPILGPLNFSVAKGETVALVGPSGIGKSTLLKMIAGIDTNYSGTITRPDTQAIVFQEPTLLPWRSAADNLRLIHPDLTPDEITAALNRVGLTGKEALFPGQLSLGQQRRLALARAFAGQPDMLILDEPFVSLDQDIAASMIALTQSLIAEQSPATLFVTHAMDEAEQLATRTLCLTPGPNGATLA